MSEDTSLVKAPRICEILREPTGYGFNLHGEKGVIGQYISAVDTGGPADRSGLSIGDRVVEVNDKTVESFSHAEVVACIKANPDKTKLLVIDKVTDSYLKGIGRSVTSDLCQYTSVYDLDNQRGESPTVSENSVHDEEKVEEVLESFNNIELEKHDSDEGEQHQQAEKADEVESNSTKEHSDSIVSNETSFYDSADSRRRSEIERNERLPPTYESIDDYHKPADNNNEAAEMKTNSATDIKTNNRAERNTSVSSVTSSEGKTSLKEKIIPKRKQVKETKTDWKAKANMFNNL